MYDESEDVLAHARPQSWSFGSLDVEVSVALMRANPKFPCNKPSSRGLREDVRTSEPVLSE